MLSEPSSGAWLLAVIIRLVGARSNYAATCGVGWGWDVNGDERLLAFPTWPHCCAGRSALPTSALVSTRRKQKKP